MSFTRVSRVLLVEAERPCNDNFDGPSYLERRARRVVRVLGVEEHGACRVALEVFFYDGFTGDALRLSAGDLLRVSYPLAWVFDRQQVVVVNGLRLRKRVCVAPPELYDATRKSPLGREESSGRVDVMRHGRWTQLGQAAAQPPRQQQQQQQQLQQQYQQQQQQPPQQQQQQQQQRQRRPREEEEEIPIVVEEEEEDSRQSLSGIGRAGAFAAASRINAEVDRAEEQAKPKKRKKKQDEPSSPQKKPPRVPLTLRQMMALQPEPKEKRDVIARVLQASVVSRDEKRVLEMNIELTDGEETIMLYATSSEKGSTCRLPDDLTVGDVLRANRIHLKAAESDQRKYLHGAFYTAYLIMRPAAAAGEEWSVLAGDPTIAVKACSKEFEEPNAQTIRLARTLLSLPAAEPVVSRRAPAPPGAIEVDDLCDVLGAADTSKAGSVVGVYCARDLEVVEVRDTDDGFSLSLQDDTGELDVFVFPEVSGPAIAKIFARQQEGDGGRKKVIDDWVSNGPYDFVIRTEKTSTLLSAKSSLSKAYAVCFYLIDVLN